jgi:hypothetical protein
MLEWRIYYSDFTEYDNLTGTWEEAPKYRVIGVNTLDPTGVFGRFLLQNHLLYYKIPGSEVMCSEEMIFLKQHVPDILESQIKHGGNAFQKDWNKLMLRMAKDTDFPRGTPKRRASDWSDGKPRLYSKRPWTVTDEAHE